MHDFATSESPAVQVQLERLADLSQPQGRIGIDAIRQLLARLGDPQDRIPPAFHVAGTNGKGSVCAFLRAMLEAQGIAVHAATSPHLVRYNERIRVAGELIADDALAALLEEVLDAATHLPISFFEATIAASFLAFARHPANACVIEVGLGGRFDATNVMASPAACGIASLGIDHERFLLTPEDGTPTEPLARIAFEKAGIAKIGTPLVAQAYPVEATKAIIDTAMKVGARTAIRDLDWSADIGDGIAYRDARGELLLPLPALPGSHQAENAALAVAMLRHQDRISVSPEAMAKGIHSARWPARLQLLREGPVTSFAPGHAVWLDGGHNPDAGQAIAQFFAGEQLHLIIGMLANKDSQAIIAPLSDRIASLHAVPLPDHECHPPEAYGADAIAARNIAEALANLPQDGLPVLIAGTLYIAGDVLRLNRQIPD